MDSIKLPIYSSEERRVKNKILNGIQLNSLDRDVILDDLELNKIHEIERYLKLKYNINIDTLNGIQ